MSRRARYHAPGATYHVMLRGNDGEEIFFSDRDRCIMSLLIQEGIERFGHRLLAYCFMTNHIHLAIQVDQVPLSRIMQNLAFRYTRYINWQQRRIGHLFQGRFKSIIVDSNRYLKQLVRYIHLNPVRAGLVLQPEEYRWSSHNAYLGNAKLVWLDPSVLLSSCADCPVEAISNFHSYVCAGINVPEEFDFKRGMHEGIFGDDDFAKAIKEKEKNPIKPQLSIPELVQAACERYQIDIITLKKPGKHRQAASVRAILSLLVCEESNATLEELAALLDRDASSLSKQVARLNIKKLSCRELQDEIAELRAYISQMPECQA